MIDLRANEVFTKSVGIMYFKRGRLKRGEVDA